MNYSRQGTWYGSFSVSEPGASPQGSRLNVGGLLTPASEGVIVNTRTHTGSVWAAFAVVGSEEEAPALDEWADVAEVWWEFAGDRVGAYAADFESAGEVMLPHPGGFTIRVYAIGRDEPGDGKPTPTERYLVVLWPEAEHRGCGLKVTSDYARELLGRSTSAPWPSAATASALPFQIPGAARGELTSTAVAEVP